MKQLLCVEDNKEMILVLEDLLRDYQVDFAHDLNEARHFLKVKRYDLVTLDVGLPDGDGIKFLGECANSPDWHATPVFVLTAHDDLSQKVSAFSLGADDYIVKPFQAPEFLARIEAKLRKSKNQINNMDSIRSGDLTISIPKQKVWQDIEGNNVTIALTSLEFKLLLNLILAKGKVLSRRNLLQEVWGEEMHVTDRTVDTHIGHLRKKIAQSKVQIHTVVGEGYRAVF